MFRRTENTDEDIRAVIEIYNSITGRDRTPDQHRWEWFSSPYENESFVITLGEGEVIGHHGILKVECDYEGGTYAVGKTENSIVKNGFGSIYPKNEFEIFKVYASKFDVLITTAAKGVTRKIREKLGYVCLAGYVDHLALVDFRHFEARVKQKHLRKIFSALLGLANIFLMQCRTDKKYSDDFAPLAEEHLEELGQFYARSKSDAIFTQRRTSSFLRYRLLRNPYSKFFLLRLYENGVLNGFLVYRRQDSKVIVEDVFAAETHLIQELLSRTFNRAKAEKLGHVLVLTTLEDSHLDKKYTRFMRRVRSVNSPVVMIKKQIQEAHSKNLSVDKFYFTRLTQEGVA